MTEVSRKRNKENCLSNQKTLIRDAAVKLT